MSNIYFRILEVLPVSSRLILATITGSEGSTPQKPGYSVLFSPEGIVTGTIGGGVLEGKVHQIAKEALISKVSGIYNFNLDKDISYEEDAICGGKVTVLVDASPGDHRAVFELAKKSLIRRIPGVLITIVKTGHENKIDIDRYWITENDKHSLPQQFLDRTETEVRNLLLKGDNDSYSELRFSHAGDRYPVFLFLEPLFSPAHLVIAGAGHIGKALARIGRMLDFELTVIDDRPEYANSYNIPDADHIIVDDIGNAMQEMKKTTDTYVVIVTRGHKDDAKALKPCFGSNMAYVGMIGSRNKIALMQKKFIKNGWATKKQWNMIHAPVGLEIKSKTVGEIAVSIAAQLVLVRNSKNQKSKG
jgi:xanthine dehydrogenase accessory factor